MMKLLASAAAFVFIASAAPVLAQDLAAGADLYNDNCAICHGSKGEGYPKEVVPDGAVRIKKLAGDSGYWDFAVFKSAVLDAIDDHGEPMQVMPAFAKVGFYTPAGQMPTEDDVKNIQAYLVTLAPKE